MSTVLKTPRLLQAAKEFNIGKNTLVEYLTNKGFAVTDSPAFKLTEVMYDAIQAEFDQDRAAKRKSEAIDLPKGGEAKKKAEDTTARSKKAEEATAPAVPKPVEKETPKAVEKPQPVAEEPKPEIKTPPVEQPQPTPPVPEPEIVTATQPEKPKPAAAIKPEPAPVAETHEEVPKPMAKAAKSGAEELPAPAPVIAQDTEEHIDIKAPQLTGPKVLGNINLDELNQSTRPKKGTKKAAVKPEEKPVVKKTATRKKEATPEATTEAPQKTIAPKAAITAEVPAADVTTSATIAPVTAVTPPVQAAVPQTPAADENKPEHIEMKAPQLTGPKIIGRIELPVPDSNKGNSGQKRDRKRIPVAKRPEAFRPGSNTGGAGTANPGANRGGQQGGGAFGGNRSGMPGQRPGGGQGQRPGGAPGQRPGGAAGNQQGGNRFNRGAAPIPGQEVDQKEIQRKIQETQARLSGTNRGKRGKDYRRDKRDLMAERRSAAENADQNKPLQVTEFISVSELASLMDVSFAEVIGKCMSLGIMVSINQRLDAEVIELVAAEFGYEVSFINLEQEADMDAEEEDDDTENQVPRAPIVTIMGHVDHGKTSLLDYIRNANVVSGEAGGITQHIGAYQVKTASDKRITFLDTPGHEAFTAMRARGAKVADIAVIVVAADDAIMPQTKEAISHAQAAGLPMIFAINKIDKEGANPEKIREQLSAMNILVEEWGGKFQSQEISAKKGLNIDNLLEKIGLESELLELKANPDKHATGSVIEASLDKGRGYVATILVQSGTLNQGDMIVCGQHYGRIKAMMNERGQRVTIAGPSAPVQILGLNGAPQAGEKFKVYDDEDEAKDVATHRAQIMREQGIRARKHLTMDELGRRIAMGNFKELPIIIKGDFDGSVEALSDSLQKLTTPEVAVNVVMKGVGAVTESDINLAAASDAIVLAFQVRPTAQAARLAEQESIEIRTYSIIYDAINDVKSAMEGLLAPKIERRVVCNVEVRDVFKITGVGTVAGCYVTDGKIFRNTRINLLRDNTVIYTGELASLKRFKDDVKEVNFGYECGMNIKNYNDIRVGDIIEGFEEVEVKRTLS